MRVNGNAPMVIVSTLPRIVTVSCIFEYFFCYFHVYATTLDLPTCIFLTVTKRNKKHTFCDFQAVLIAVTIPMNGIVVSIHQYNAFAFDFIFLASSA